MTTQEAKRKLTAILSADVKGYSRLMSEDEILAGFFLYSSYGKLVDIECYSVDTACTGP